MLAQIYPPAVTSCTAGCTIVAPGENLSVAFNAVEASKYQKHGTHLWLRIAECCMIENEKLQNKAESEALNAASMALL